MRIRTLKLSISTLDASAFPRSPWPEIAVCGRSNVGKSSLLNVLFERRSFARISKDPGKTRALNFYAVNDAFFFVDLPGYGYARISQETRRLWASVLGGYFSGREGLAGVVQLIDSRHPPTGDDVENLERLASSGRPCLVAFTKADKISRSERPRVLRDFREATGASAVLGRPAAPAAAAEGGGSNGGAVPAIFFSARTGEGKDELWAWIEARLKRARG